jgi:hypothetical protein
MKVDAISVEGEGPDGQKITGLECSECGQKFFDEFSVGSSPQLIEGAVEKFIEHADQDHHSSGGVIGGKRRGEWRVCA